MHNIVIAVAKALDKEINDHPNIREWVEIHTIDGLIFDSDLAHGAAIYEDKAREFKPYQDMAMALYDHDRARMRKAMNGFGDAAGMRGKKASRLWGSIYSLWFVMAAVIFIFCLIY